MANNRMILVCNVCQPRDEWEKNTRYGVELGAIAIAKWYPAGGFIAGEDGSYYSNLSAQEFGEKFLLFLSEHQHKEVASEKYSAGAGQENPVRIEYESVGLPKL